MNRTFNSVLIFVLVLNSLSCGTGSDHFAQSRNLGTSSVKDDFGNTRTITVASLPSTTLDPTTLANGLYIEMSNSLANHKPQLSLKVCSHNQNQSSDKLCFVSDVVIDYQSKGHFYLEQGNFSKILNLSTNNSIQFEFNDTYSNSRIHWHCSEFPSSKVNNPGALVRMKVGVTQINNVSYSCTVTQL